MVKLQLKCVLSQGYPRLCAVIIGKEEDGGILVRNSPAYNQKVPTPQESSIGTIGIESRII